MKLWDLRNLGAGTGADGVGGMKAIAEMPHFRSVNSAHFSPGGEWLATVGQDDKVKLYKDLEKHSGGSKVMIDVCCTGNVNVTFKYLCLC